MKKLLAKSLLAIAATSAITACSTVELYPRNQAEVVTLSPYRFSQLEVILTEVDTKQTQVLVYDLVKDRLAPQNYQGSLGNKNINLHISIDDCALCVGTDMQVKTKIQTSDIIKSTSIETSQIETIEIPSIETEPMVDKSDKPADTTPAPTSKITLQESLGDGEEVIEDESPATLAPEVAVVQPLQPTEPVSQFTKPEGVKPFLYVGEAQDFNNLFTQTTHIMQKSLVPTGDHYIDVIYSEETKQNTVIHTPVPVTVKVRLVEMQPLELKK